ncbi:MAG: hypothetical protein AB1714_01350 [Acidobacteriota bacterium]
MGAWCLRVHLSLALLAACQSPALSQQVAWSLRWGGVEARDAAQGIGLDATGGLSVGGDTMGLGAYPGTHDLLLLKYDPAGALQWARTWGAQGEDYGYDVAAGPGGESTLVGRSDSFSSSFDALIVKYDPQGNLVWARTWGGPGGEAATGAAQDPEGNLYVTGYTTSFGAGDYDLFLLRYDPAGNVQWARTWGGRANDTGYTAYQPDVTLDVFGNVYVVSSTYSFGSNAGFGEDVVVLKYDPTGVLQWAKTWGTGAEFEEAQAVSVDARGNLLIAGMVTSDALSYDAFVLSLDSSGFLNWGRRLDVSGDDELITIDLDIEGNIYAAGISAGSSYDLLLAKLDGAGDTIWVRKWGAEGNDYACAAVCSEAGLTLAGVDYSVGAAVLESPEFTMSALPPVSAAPVSGAIETTPVAVESTPQGTQTAPSGASEGSVSGNVLVLALRTRDTN